MREFLAEMMWQGGEAELPAGANGWPEKLGFRPVKHVDGLRYVAVPAPGVAGRFLWVAQTPVTVAAYKRFAADTGRKVRGGQKGEDHPVFYVTWEEVADGGGMGALRDGRGERRSIRADGRDCLA
jgi:formylglycine-generating enzyme required for sulfatase activity